MDFKTASLCERDPLLYLGRTVEKLGGLLSAADLPEPTSHHLSLGCVIHCSMDGSSSLCDGAPMRFEPPMGIG